jgi:hypothetical protein
MMSAYLPLDRVYNRVRDIVYNRVRDIVYNRVRDIVSVVVSSKFNLQIFLLNFFCYELFAKQKKD